MQNTAVQTEAQTPETAQTNDKPAQKAGGAFRTISEVAEELNVQQHVLRFWETKFSQIRPMKRGGGRRYYRPEDVQLLKHIHTLLYSEGYTIKGAQKLLKGQSKGSIAAAETAATAAAAAEKAQSTAQNIAPIKAASTPANQAVQEAQPQAAQDSANAQALPQAMVDALQGMLGDLKELRALVGK